MAGTSAAAVVVPASSRRKRAESAGWARKSKRADSQHQSESTAVTVRPGLRRKPRKAYRTSATPLRQVEPGNRRHNLKDGSTERWLHRKREQAPEGGKLLLAASVFSTTASNPETMHMRFSEQPLGHTAVFLLPSLKLKEPSLGGKSIETQLHAFLMDHFGGYTAQAGNIFGYWRNGPGPDSYGEHREFSVAFSDPAKLPLLKEFLATMAGDLQEDCIYLRVGDEASLIYPRPGELSVVPPTSEPLR